MADQNPFLAPQSSPPSGEPRSVDAGRGVEWLKQGWQDISPLWGDKATVPTFKDKKAVIERWPEFQEEMLSVMADWYYVSGHHGCRFANDVGESDFFEFTQTYEHAGFFNEPYHVGPWEHADSNNPDAGRSSLDVYMSTSFTDWENPYSPGPEDNPLHYNSQENCKGILLVGCRALGYLCSRQAWGAYFPNAVIIGPVTSRIAGTSALAAPISCAGTVLSQAPSMTTASMGCARIISSVSMAIRLRSSMVVGEQKDSCSEMVGNTKGIPPAASTPRLTASITCGAVAWHGLKSEAVEPMPTTGRSRTSSP